VVKRNVRKKITIVIEENYYHKYWKGEWIGKLNNEVQNTTYKIRKKTANDQQLAVILLQ